MGMPGNDGPGVSWAQRVSQRRRHCVLTRFKSNEIIEATSPLRLYRAYCTLWTHIEMISAKGKKGKKTRQKSYATSNDADVQSLGYYVAAACSILTIFSSFFFILYFFPSSSFPTEYKFTSSANVWLRHDRLDMHSESRQVEDWKRRRRRKVSYIDAKGHLVYACGKR